MLKLTVYTNCYNTRKLKCNSQFLKNKAILLVNKESGKVLLEIDYYSQFAGVVTISILSQFEHEIGLIRQ